MLLFVKQRFVDEILAGRKRYEIRSGRRYLNVKPGDSLSINGRFRVTVTSVESHSRDTLLRSFPISSADLADCYPHQADFRVFRFDPPQRSA